MKTLRKVMSQVEANSYEAGRRGMIFVGSGDFLFPSYKAPVKATIFLYYKEKNDSYYFFAKGDGVSGGEKLEKVKEYRAKDDDPFYRAISDLVYQYNERIEIQQAARETEKESERSKSL